VGPSAVGWAAVIAWVSGLTGVLLWPIVHAGYGLGHDMVFTPQQPLDAASLGVSSAAPRAAPLDALVALTEHPLGGAVVFRLALVLPLLAVGIGVALAGRPRSLPPALVAATFAVWNPYVVERLAIGQWALLWAYAALPWLVVAARQRWWPRLALTVVAVGLASITPTGGLIAAALTVALLIGRAPARPHRTGRIVVVLVAVSTLQLPWVLPALLSTASSTSDPAAVAAFASRADSGGGVLGSLVAGAGIWDADVVPSSRGGLLALVALLVVVIVAVVGARELVDRLGRRTVVALAGSAGLGLVLAAAGSLPGGAALVRSAVSTVPGAGLLRDGQKWVMPLVLLSALLAGAAAQTARAQVRSASWRVIVALAMALLPVLVLPDAAATVAPTVRPVHYPADWSAVRRAAAGGGAVVVVPFAAYRTFGWAPGRPVLDPAPRLLTVPVVVDDRLSVSGHLLAGEDQHARHVGEVLAGGPGQPALVPGLQSLGVRWVAVEHGTPGPVPDLSGLTPVQQGADVSLYRVPGTVQAVAPERWRVRLVAGVDLLALALVTAGALGSGGKLSRSVAGRRASRPPQTAG
jgi:hypothetical protein